MPSDRLDHAEQTERGKAAESLNPETLRYPAASGTTVYAYDGDNITEELGAGGNLLAHYTQGAGVDEPLALTGTDGTYFYHADSLGSITSLTNGSGQLAPSYVFDSFGKLTASTGTITNPFQYTACEFDSETGLYSYRARYYDPSAGRFLNEDPLGFTGGINRYLYVRNSPVIGIDPSGTTNSIEHFFTSQEAWWLTNNNGFWGTLAKNPLFYLSDVLADVGTQGPSAREANRHAMAGLKPDGTRQTCKEALAGAAQYIADFMSKGQVGEALHVGEDWGTPSHGGQFWPGGWPSKAHLKGDWWDWSWQNFSDRIHNDRWIMDNLPVSGQTITPAMVMKNMRGAACGCQ